MNHKHESSLGTFQRRIAKWWEQSLPDLCSGDRENSSYSECLAMFNQHLAPDISKVCILDPSSSQLVSVFCEFFRSKPHGCLTNQRVLGSLPNKLRPRFKVMDPHRYLETIAPTGLRFDLIFLPFDANRPPKIVTEALTIAQELTTYLYFDHMSRGVRSRSQDQWWQSQLERVGFEECLNMWGGRSCLWRSTACESFRSI